MPPALVAPPREPSLEEPREPSLEDVLAAALGAAARVVGALDRDGRRALRRASAQCRASVDAAVAKLVVIREGPLESPPPPPPTAQRFPALRRLQFYYGGAPVALPDAEALGAFPLLEELTFGGGCTLGPAEAAALARAAPRLPALRALTFDNCRFADGAGAALFGVPWPALRAVTFFICTGGGAAALAAAWRNLEALERLDIRGASVFCRTPAADIRAIATAGWRLEELFLSNPALSNAEVAALAGAPALRVRALSLPCCDVRAAALRALAAPSCALRGLTALDLKGSYIGARHDRDAGPALAALAARHPLAALRLASCGLGTAGVEAVASAEWSVLAELDLDFNGADVGAFGAAAFARTPKLAALDLDGNRVGPAGARLLAARVGAHLTRLSLQGAWRGDAGAGAGAAELAVGAWPALRSVDLTGFGPLRALGVEEVRRWAPAISEVFSDDAPRPRARRARGGL
jgi:hypothetical protein